MKPKRINKWLYGWKLYVDYGQGWEYECFEATYKQYLENKKAYRLNCPYPQKWNRGREINDDWVCQQSELERERRNANNGMGNC